MRSKNDVIDEAKRFCIEHKERLTKPRLEILKIIAESAKPLGAYEILEHLKEVMDNPKPPTAYRAIEFWKEKRFIHRIESLGAYVLCCADHRHQGSQFMICDQCGVTIEIHLCALPTALQKSAEKNGFNPLSWNTEIHGLCAECDSV